MLLDAVSVCLSSSTSAFALCGHSGRSQSSSVQRVGTVQSLLSRQETGWFFEKKNDASPDMTLCRPN